MVLSGIGKLMDSRLKPCGNDLKMESAIKEALELLAASREGALATLEGAVPFVSAVGFVYIPPAGSQEPWGKIQLFLSELARHTRNFQKNPNVSLLITENGPAPAYEKKRVTAQGTIGRVTEEIQVTEFKTRYLRAFPSAEMLFGFSDFRCFEIKISEIHWIGGVGEKE